MGRIVVTSNGIINPVEVRDAGEQVIAGFDPVGNILGANLREQNLIHNPDHRINQLGWTSAVIPDAGTVWVADRWAGQKGPSGSSVTLRHEAYAASAGDQAAGVTAYTWLDCITVPGDLTGQWGFISQRLEGRDIAPLLWGSSQAKTVTLSFKHAHSAAGTYTVALRNQGLTRSYVAEYTQAVGGAWEHTEITIPGCPDGTWNTGPAIGLEIYWTAFAGPSLETTAGAWISANKTSTPNQDNVTSGGNIIISNCKLEVGDKATAFEHPDFATELVKCHRYLLHTWDYAAALNATYQGVQRTLSDANGVAILMCQFINEMRATPAVGCYSPASGNANFMNINGAEVACGINHIGRKGVNAVAAGDALSNAYGHFLCDARI